jgi:hypothetical protein
MARTTYTCNIDIELDKAIAEIAKASQTSKSEQVNLALEAALADMPQTISKVMSKPTGWSKTKPGAYAVARETQDLLTEVSATLAISKLAMRSYILSKSDYN